MGDATTTPSPPVEMQTPSSRSPSSPSKASPSQSSGIPGHGRRQGPVQQRSWHQEAGQHDRWEYMSSQALFYSSYVLGNG